jgi:hypothetical protein
MISVIDLKSIARARLADSRALLARGRYDGAVYLCGYAVEMALKVRICRTLKWPGFPETSAEWRGFTSLKVHNFDLLLRFSGAEPLIRTKYMAEWSTVRDWQPELRYEPVGVASQVYAEEMIRAASKLVRIL